MTTSSKAHSLPSAVPSDRPRESSEFAIERAPASAIHVGRTGASLKLYASAYGTIERDPRVGFVRFTRTEIAYPSIALVEQEASEIERVLDRCGRPRLLVDLRAAPPRNDPAFEVVMAGFRRKLLKGSERMAIVVRTAVGALQVKRHMREDGFTGEVFQGEEEAISYLDAPPDSAPRITLMPPSPRSRGRERQR